MPAVEESTDRWGIIGHAWAVRLLQLAVERGRLSHAYLFLGHPRVGKTTLALALAKAINCTGEAPPCGQCRNCTLIAAGRHPDVRVIEGGEVRAIRIDQVRDLQREVMLSPVEARQRVVVLTDFQGATPEAGNCLLKTLEEPPARVTLILTATQVGRLLPTIVSRCQPLWLRPPATAALAQGLERLLGAPVERAQEVARLAGGRVGWAVEAVRDGGLLQERQEQLDRLRQVLAADTLGRLRWARDLSDEPDALPGLLDLWAGWWRDLLLCRAGCLDLVANVDYQGAIEATARSFDEASLLQGLRALSDARRRLDANANPRLTLEVLFLTLGQAQGIG